MFLCPVSLIGSLSDFCIFILFIPDGRWILPFLSLKYECNIFPRIFFFYIGVFKGIDCLDSPFFLHVNLWNFCCILFYKYFIKKIIFFLNSVFCIVFFKRVIFFNHTNHFFIHKFNYFILRCKLNALNFQYKIKILLLFLVIKKIKD